MKKITAFTLAEVLITLGVIGVVSAITMPTLIQSYRNQVVETRLQKVYSVMNQAIQRAEADYGAKELWDFEDADFYNKYYAPYIKILKTEIKNAGNQYYRIIYFPDGSILTMKEIGHHDYNFYPSGKNFTEKSLNEDKSSATGVILFPFRFAPVEEFINSDEINYHYRKGFLPYAHHWDGVTDLKNHDRYSCKKDNKYSGNGKSYPPNFCTMYIMQNGWKIPKDYPFKVR